MTAKQRVSILHHFASLPDPRLDRTRRHELLDIIVIAICAVICSADSWEDVETFGRAKRDWLKTFLQLPNGIPSHDTFNRVFALLDPEAFQHCFLSWIQALSAEAGTPTIAVDGKTLRRSFDRASCKGALHLVSAWATANHLTLGQVAVDAHSNEITAIPKLLEILDVSGAIVTIDAMGCQKEIAAQIREGGGDYVLALKDNQERLLEDVQACFQPYLDSGTKRAGHSQHTTTDQGHGRKERRHYFVINHPDGIRDQALWRDLQAICLVVRERTVHGETTTGAHYYIGSREGTAEEYSAWIRGHWGIENSLHWVLDVTFREDDSRLRSGHGPENLALLRRVAVSLLKNDKASKHSVHTKRLQAGWDDEYLLKVLCGVSKE